jgi:transposase
MTKRIAGIDVHKRVLMVVVVSVGEDGSAERTVEKKRCGTLFTELDELRDWLREKGVTEVVMESTAQYWKPVWLALEDGFELGLAQAWSNRAPRGKKTDFKDAERLARRHLAGELTMSFVPGPEQRQMRELTRRNAQLNRELVRIQNHVESLLEPTRIKLSGVISDLFGATGRRILHALAEGESDPEKLAALADARVQCPLPRLVNALRGNMTPIQRRLLKQMLQDAALAEAQKKELEEMTGELMRRHSGPIQRLTRVPGIRLRTAEDVIAEIGPDARAFPRAAQLSSWVGACPGRDESAEQNYNARCAKGNMSLRRALCEAAQAAVKTKNCRFQQKFKRLLPRLGYPKAIWAIVRLLCIVIWKILHEGADYVEHGGQTTLGAIRRRAQRLNRELRAAGLSLIIVPLTSQTPPISPATEG